MLDELTVRALDLWCDRGALSWSAAHLAGQTPVVILRPMDRGRSWRYLRLVLGEPESRVENEDGEILAIASDFPALLDAVDGGVGEPFVSPARQLAGLLSHRAAAPIAVVF